MATNTLNYKLKKPAQTDFYNIEDQNGNMDVIDAELKKVNDNVTALGETVATHLAEKATTAKAGHVQLSNATDSTSEALAATPKAVKAAMDRANEAFQSGVDGKNKLETAILAKKGTVSKQETIATFDELDLGIKSIPEEDLRRFPRQSYSRLGSITAIRSVVNPQNKEVYLRGSGATWYLDEYDKNNNIIKTVPFNLPFSANTSGMLLTPYTVHFYRNSADGYDIYDHNGNLLYTKFGRVGLHHDVIKHILTNELLFLDCRVTANTWQINIVDTNRNTVFTTSFSDGTTALDSTLCYTKAFAKGLILCSSYQTTTGRDYGLVIQNDDGTFMREILYTENTNGVTTRMISFLATILRRGI